MPEIGRRKAGILALPCVAWRNRYQVIQSSESALLGDLVLLVYAAVYSPSPAARSTILVT